MGLPYLLMTKCGLGKLKRSKLYRHYCTSLGNSFTERKVFKKNNI